MYHAMHYVFLTENLSDLLSFAYGFASSSSFFSFSFYARLFVMLSATSFSQNSILLNLAIETFKRYFKRVIFADFDF